MRQRLVPLGVGLTMLLIVAASGSAWADRTSAARQEGFRLYEAGRFRESAASLDQVIERHPRDIEALIKRGNSYLRLDEPAKALADFDRVTRFSPLLPGGYTDRGVALLMLGRNDEALESFTRAVQLWGLPTNAAGSLIAGRSQSIVVGKATAHGGLAQTYHRLGQNEQAIEEYDRAIAIHAGDPNMYIGRGDAQAALGAREQALADYTEAIRLGPGYSRAYGSRGLLLANMGRDDDALADFDRAIQLDPNDAHAYSLRGAVLSRRGENERALADYHAVIRLLPDRAGGYKDRGGVLVRLGRNQQAIEDLNKAIELDPAKATAYLNRGAAYSNLGRFDRAIEDLNRAIKLDPKNAGAHTNCGLAYFMVGDYERAIEDLSEAVRLAPGNAVVHFNRGNVYARLGFKDRAIEDYQVANRLNPRLIASQGGMARLQEELRRHDLAVRDSLALRPGPDPKDQETDALFERGNARRAQGDWKGAIADFSRVIESDPKRADAYVARGWSRLCAGVGGAEIDARAYLDLKGWREPFASYMALLGVIAARQAGKTTDARAFLDEATANSPAGAWPSPVLRYLRHELPPSALLERAASESQKTEAHTFIALDLLRAGDPTAALGHLHWVRDHGAARSIAADLARATLQRIENTRTVSSTP